MCGVGDLLHTKHQGPALYPEISKDASERENGVIISHRKMHMTKLYKSRAQYILNKVIEIFQSWNSTAERNYILQEQSIAQPPRYVSYVSKQSEKAKSKFEEACTASKESELRYDLALKAYNKAIARTNSGPASA